MAIKLPSFGGLVLFFAILSSFYLGVFANTGSATWYYTGQGACGARSDNHDVVVALSRGEFANGAHCYKHVAIHHQGKWVDATIVDMCEGCDQYSIDLSLGAFEPLAPLSDGRITVDWFYKK